jgi:hypothetical protein
MGRQSFVTVFRDMVMIGPGLRCGINMDRGIGEILQMVKKFVPELLGNRVATLDRKSLKMIVW